MSGERKKEIRLSTDILTDVFHYCSRKDLGQKFSCVNSKFRHFSQNLPSLHVIYGIKFWPTTVNIQSKRLGSIFSRILLFADLPTLQPFVRFQNVSIHIQYNKSLPSFLYSSKQSFVGSKLDIQTILKSEKVITQTIEVLNTNLLDLYSIRQAGIIFDKFLPTMGVLNCDKLTFMVTHLTSDMTVTFAKWLYWKQGQENSRRHLIFEYCILPYDIVLWFQKEFLTATSPANYMVSFVAYKCKEVSGLLNGKKFCLENKETGERLTMFKYTGEKNRKTTFRIWRRIPIQDDNQKNVDAEHLSMLSGECATNDSFDKDFYHV